jgi:Phosphotransferase enzyme family
MTVDPLLVSRAALNEDVLSATVTRRIAISYDVFLPGRGADRASGVATMANGDTRSWAAIIKHTRLDGLRAAKRELCAYRSGVADSNPNAFLRAPRLFGFDDGPQHVELWLEELRDHHDGNWPTTQFGVAARHIALHNASLIANPIEGYRAETGWGEQHGQPHRIPEVLDRLKILRNQRGAEELMSRLEDDGFARTLSMIQETPTRLERLAQLPQVVLHHDLVRSNLFALTPTTTAAIDWENVGLGPLGVDLVPLVHGSVRRGEASADDLLTLRDTALAQYEAGLNEAHVDASTVRSAYDLAAALRWHVVLGTITAWLDPTITGMRGTRPNEPRAEGLRHLIKLSSYLLDTADRTA